MPLYKLAPWGALPPPNPDIPDSNIRRAIVAADPNAALVTLGQATNEVALNVAANNPVVPLQNLVASVGDVSTHLQGLQGTLQDGGVRAVDVLLLEIQQSTHGVIERLEALERAILSLHDKAGRAARRGPKGGGRGRRGAIY